MGFGFKTHTTATIMKRQRFYAEKCSLTLLISPAKRSYHNRIDTPALHDVLDAISRMEAAIEKLEERALQAEKRIERLEIVLQGLVSNPLTPTPVAASNFSCPSIAPRIPTVNLRIPRPDAADDNTGTTMSSRCRRIHQLANLYRYKPLNREGDIRILNVAC